MALRRIASQLLPRLSQPAGLGAALCPYQQQALASFSSVVLLTSASSTSEQQRDLGASAGAGPDAPAPSSQQQGTWQRRHILKNVFDNMTAASTSSPLWWLQGGGTQGLSPLLASCSSGLQHQQWREYKSLKKSMKPVYAKASKLAVQPYLPVRSSRSRSKFRNAPVVDTVLPEIPQVPQPPVYRRVGAIRSEYQLHTVPAFAVVALDGRQFKVTVDDVLFVSHLPEVAVNEVLALDRVLLLGDRHSTTIGRPFVPGASVLAAVEEHFKDGKVHVFKLKKRNRYHKYSAPRQALTTLRILRVQGPEGPLGEGPDAQGQELPKQQLPISYYEESSGKAQPASAAVGPGGSVGGQGAAQG